MQHLSEAFAREEISLEVLPLLTESHLERLGVATIGARLRILDAIDQLKSARADSGRHAAAALAAASVSPLNASSSSTTTTTSKGTASLLDTNMAPGLNLLGLQVAVDNLALSLASLSSYVLPALATLRQPIAVHYPVIPPPPPPPPPPMSAAAAAAVPPPSSPSSARHQSLPRVAVAVASPVPIPVPVSVVAAAPPTPAASSPSRSSPTHDAPAGKARQ